MIGAERLAKMDEALCGAFAAHLGVKASGLQKALNRAGRRLPKRQQANGALILQAMERVEHPKLQAQINDAAVERAFSELKTYLEGIDRQQARITSAVRWGSGLAFNLLVLVALVIVVLRLRGLV